MRTVTVTEHARITYCADGTYKGPGLSSTGNWSKNGTPELTDGFLNAVGVRDNFTLKWLIERFIRLQFLHSAKQTHFIEKELPSMDPLNCQLIDTTVDALITVDIGRDAVQMFSIVNGPNLSTGA